MGMFDTVYAKLDCPFCGRQYRHTPMTWEEAEREVKQHQQWQIESRQRHLRGEEYPFDLQYNWAKRDGFDDVDVWIAQLDAPEHIESYRTRKHLGLAEIQTKEFECALAEFYIGDEVPKYSGHYFILEDFRCEGCSTKDESVYVKVWLEIEERKLKAVLVRDPETGDPARGAFKHPPAEPRPPDPHPPLFFKRGGKNPQDGTSLHDHLHSICRHLPSDFEPYGERERDGPDCSYECRHFLKLPGKLGMDWGVCANPASPRAGLLTFEHQGCEQFEASPVVD